MVKLKRIIVPNPEREIERKSGLPLNWLLNIIGFSILAISAFFLFPELSRNTPASLRGSNPEELSISAFPIVVPTVKYGFALDTLQVVEGEFQRGQVLGDLLSRYGVSAVTIQALVDNSKGVFSVSDLQTGKPFLLLSKDTTSGLDYMVYEPSLYEYYVFHVKAEEPYIENVKRKVDTVTQTVEGVIQSSLWQALEDNGANPQLIAKLEDALQWSIDFHHLQEGDRFKALYDQNYIEGQEVDPGKVHAAVYTTGGKDLYAIYYEHGGERGYYNQEGRPMNKGFLKAPVKFSRISSFYNLNRFHPILRRTRPHFGTDYAAPYGTEIYAVGDGVIKAASYTSGNGNFVKIKHNKTYTTQYLHMSRFARGIRGGVRVHQGQVIGYVGSTGLATGPHVCFRFWMNGRQVNHLKLSFPPPEPLPKDVLPEFFKHRDSLLTKLNGIKPGLGENTAP